LPDSSHEASGKPGAVQKSVLVTNGSLLTTKLLRGLEASVDTVQITIDGPQDRHDRLRHFVDGRGSFAAVMRALDLTMQSALPNVVVRTNFAPGDVDTVRGFINSLATELEDPQRVQMSFASIAPMLSERFMAQGVPPDTEGLRTSITLQGEAVRAGFAGGQASRVFPSGSCSARKPNSLVVDQDLNVFKCPLQMPNNACAEILADGSLVVKAEPWYALPNEIPECVFSCVYGPICGGGCPLSSFTPERGKEGCEYRDHTALRIETTLRERLRSTEPHPREVHA